MTSTSRVGFILCVSLMTAGSFAADQARQRQSFVFDWQFFKGDSPGAEQPDFNTAGWRTLDLPHDWSIEGPWAQDNPTAGPGGFVPAGVGWYRKIFTLPESQRGKSFLIEFDGVYMNSDVWINGRHLGRWPFGYTSFAYDLSPYLKFGAERNVLAVRVDNSDQSNSRWYSGSGIYRNVWLTITDPLRVGHWGTYVTTPKASVESATVRVRTRLENGRGSAGAVTLTSELLDREGRVVASGEEQKPIAPSASVEFDQTLDLGNPQRWSIGSPYLYTVRSLVKVNGQVVDDYLTPIGVREIIYDVNRGFLLNGEPVKMQGVCLHHDAGNLGAAVPERVWERRLQILKQMGCNAIRTAHNPPDPVLLDLCDRMGFLVMDEIFDEWTVKKPQIRVGYSKYFDEWHERDTVNFIRRDRNHPSVVMWSAGNEIGEQRDPKGPPVLGKLMTIFHREDPTRPVTAGMDNVYTDQGNAPEAFTDLLDIVGYNYVDRWVSRRETFYADDRYKYPQRKFVGTESNSIGGVRNSYQLPTSPSDAAAAGRGRGRGGRGSYATSMIRVEQLWKFVKVHDYVIGDFMWTGIDYLGETGWPRKGAGSGQIDTAGFPKDGYYFYQSQWTPEPMIHLLPHWNWSGQEGRVISVVAYTNCDTVELFVNGRSFGAKSLEFPRQGTRGGWNTYARPVVAGSTADLHLSWDVPYAPGTVRAVGRRNGQVVCETDVRTTGAPAKIKLEADRSVTRPDARDVVHFTLRILDEQGSLVPAASLPIRFELQGPARLLAVDNGDLSDLTQPTALEHRTFNGLALIVVQTTRQSGTIKLVARSEGLADATIEVSARGDP